MGFRMAPNEFGKQSDILASFPKNLHGYIFYHTDIAYNHPLSYWLIFNF